MTTIVEQHKQWKRENPLREWRTEQGVTIHEAAAMIGCSMTTIQLWESGSAKPSSKHMERLTKVVGPNFHARLDRWFAKSPTSNL